MKELKRQTVFSIGGIRTIRTVRDIRPLNEHQDCGIVTINNAFYSASRLSEDMWRATHKVMWNGTGYTPVQ